MKHLLHKLTALILASLMLLGAAPVFGAAEQPDPSCTLGTFSADMLAGGTMVRTEDGLFYVGDDGLIYDSDRGDTPVYTGQAARLNYQDGVLYFARMHGERFDLVGYELASGTETVYLEDCAGPLRQLYLVDGSRLVFLSDGAVQELTLSTRALRTLRTDEHLWSFVPTGCGLIWAAGGLFDYSLYAEDRLLAERVERYYVEPSADGGMLVYTQGGEDYQIPLRDAFGGAVRPVKYAGAAAPQAEAERRTAGLSEDAILALEANGAEHSHDGLEDLDEAAEAELAKKMEGYPRPLTSVNIGNAVKRASQMTEIRWTPLENVQSWGSYFTYEAGKTYKGLPYSQAVGGSYGGHYVPWYTSLDGFLSVVNSENSLFYTSRCTYGRGGPAYGTDCSAFVSWALDLPSRCNTSNITKYGTQKASTYSAIQVGDFLNSSSHAVLVTDVAYNPDGSMAGVEISEATIWWYSSTSKDPKEGLCRSTWYTGSSGLAKLQSKYFGGGYLLYSRNCDRDITYTHSCAVPLPGDECPICGKKPGVEVSSAQGEIDWETLATAIDFAILRIGWSNADGTFCFDSRYLENVEGCKANDIPYGLYFESNAKTNSYSMQEASRVFTKLNETQYLDYNPQLPIFLVPEQSVLDSLSGDELIPVVNGFCEYLENCGFPTGLRANESAWNAKLTDEYYKYKVGWAVKWADADGSLSPEQQITLNVSVGANLWQLGRRSMPGIAGAVNLSYLFGNLESDTHRYNATVTPPSCAVTGNMSLSCVDCEEGGIKTLKVLSHVAGPEQRENENAPTCTEAGAYDSVTKCAVCGELMERIRTEIPAMGHEWCEPVFNWNGYRSAVATRTCARDASHIETKDATVTSEITVEATPTTEGVKTYTATVVFDGMTYTDTKTEPIPATGYTWGDPTWKWAEDGSTATATFTSNEDDTVRQTVDAEISSVVEIEPDCTMAGRRENTAKVTFLDREYTDVRTYVIPALGHAWSDPVFYWNGYESAMAKRTCANNPAHAEAKDASVTAEVILAPTMTEDGIRIHIATVEFDGKTYTEVKMETIPSVGFVDVKEGDFFYEAVLWAYYHVPQITAGTSKTKFSPSNTCTREQVVTFLWRAKGCQEPTSTENPFKDVPADAYYTKAVLWAVEKGVTNGKSKTKFGVGDPCTREQVVTFLWRAEGEPEHETAENPFTDVSETAYSYDAILWAVENDITKGTSKTKFSPAKTCTRGQIVTFLYRAYP